jgi:beta-galactosidase
VPLVLSVEGDQFVVDGQPARILSGAIHYFRVVPEYWYDRLAKLKACGLNTVETYVPWNMHEPQPGNFRFEGMLDIERFIRIAAELELMVIVRPGPYICSEWDLGGLPPWLLADPGMRVRCSYTPYLQAVDRYLDALLARLVPLQASHGGPIIAMQVENEYGSYGSDKEYLRYLEQAMRARGIDVLLFTSDGPSDSMLQGGTLPHLLKTANFGSNAKGAFAKLREHQPTGPLMCCEYWNGWFDHWGEKHHTRDAQDAAKALDNILALGGSVNLYMFHGGTNFGFMNGANHSGSRYQPDVTSYDYDAALDETGEPTAKFFAFRDVIGKYAPLPDLELPPPTPRKAYGEVQLSEEAPLFASLENLSLPKRRPTPEPMEMLGQNYGFVLYRTQVAGPREESSLIVQHLRDRAQVFVDGKYVGLLERDTPQAPIKLAFGPGSHTLEILVENMGRINYGPLLHDRKGITEGVRLGNQFLHTWTIYPLPLDDLSRLRYGPVNLLQGPAFYRGHFAVDAPADTFLALPGWTKGVCFVNGFNLGRYWDTGPQRTLYIPGPLLRAGVNELTIFELHQAKRPVVELVDAPCLG